MLQKELKILTEEVIASLTRWEFISAAISVAGFEGIGTIRENTRSDTNAGDRDRPPAALSPSSGSKPALQTAGSRHCHGEASRPFKHSIDKAFRIELLAVRLLSCSISWRSIGREANNDRTRDRTGTARLKTIAVRSLVPCRDRSGAAAIGGLRKLKPLL